jgi:hypothetical protein
MAKARGKPTPVKKRAGAAVRAKAEAPRKPDRVPRSTQRSAMPELPPTGRNRKRHTGRDGGDHAPAGHDGARQTARRGKRQAKGEAAPAEPPKAMRARVGPSPRAASVGEIDRSGELQPFTDDGHEPEPSGHVMELHWGDDAPSSRRSDGLVQRWVKRGDALLRHLAEHGAARHEYRADLKDGRFVWVDPEGRVSAEAQAQVLCSWSRSTLALAMAWADPLVRAAGIGRIDGVPAERDDVDEETAWRVAMKAADHASADYLYRVTTPHAWYFLALSGLTFHPERASFSPGTPVGLVLRGLAETRRAVESRAEPAEVVRDRLSGLGQALLLEAEYAYRNTDWVARLERTGRRLVSLGHQLPRASFTSLAAGHNAGEWLDRKATIDLSDALALLEDEWALFS